MVDTQGSFCYLLIIAPTPAQPLFSPLRSLATMAPRLFPIPSPFPLRHVGPNLKIQRREMLPAGPAGRLGAAIRLPVLSFDCLLPSHFPPHHSLPQTSSAIVQIQA